MDQNRKQDDRALPQYAPAEREENELGVASPTALREPQEEVELLSMAEEILSQLSTPVERMLAAQSPMPIATAAAFLEEICRNMESVTVEVPKDTLAAVTTCIHNLFFCLGTVIHYAIAHVEHVRVFTEIGETEGYFYVEADTAAASKQEVLACFGLTPERLFVLQKIATASDFSFRAVAGDRATLVFTLPRTEAHTIPLRAAGDTTLRAAFLLPLTVFS